MKLFKAIKKPIEIEAFQLKDSMLYKDIVFQHKDRSVFPKGDSVHFVIETLEGEMTAKSGDYIIIGVKGEIYPCRKDIFEETYEKNGS